MNGSPASLHAIAYVVPTKDRRDDLRKLLESLARQTVRPDQIVIVDASDPPIRDLTDEYPQLPLTYVREFPPSLARQRNAGMAAISDHITIAGYIDDDLELAEDATERMLAYWSGAPTSVGGAAFTIVNQPSRHPLFGLLADVFLINGRKVGAVLPSGFPTSITPQQTDTRTEWLYGGATLWRREVIERYSYDEWYIGHGFLEDLDYSYRVSQSFELWLVADARCWHWPKPVLKRQNTRLGRQQVVNRLYFVRKLGTFSRLALCWALFGQCVRNVLESLHGRNTAGLYRFWGNLQGLTDVARGKSGSVEGIWK